MMKTKKGFLNQNWLLILAIVYLLSPIDLIPDILPLLGKLDDALVMVIELLMRYKRYDRTLKRVDEKTFAEDE